MHPLLLHCRQERQNILLARTFDPMKKIISIAILAACTSCLFISCMKEKPRSPARAQQVIIDNYYVDEPNPLYSAETAEINELFRYSFTKRNALKPGERQRIYSRALALYKANNEAELEDAVDEARVMMRKSLCMATAALVARSKEAVLEHFASARESLSRDGIPDELMEDDYSALLVLELLYLQEHRIPGETDKDAAIIVISGFDNMTRKSKEAFIEVIREF